MARGQTGSLFLFLYESFIHCSMPVAPKTTSVCPAIHSVGVGYDSNGQTETTQTAEVMMGPAIPPPLARRALGITKRHSLL